jgi:soluble cytochrome b562
MNQRLLPAIFAAIFCATANAAEDPPLVKHMEQLDDAYKALRKTEDAAKGAELARDAQNAAVKTLGEIPTMISKMPDGPARDKAAATYRHMVGQLYVKLCEIEKAFLDNQLDRVAAIVEEIKELKKQGHNEFMEDE